MFISGLFIPFRNGFPLGNGGKGFFSGNFSHTTFSWSKLKHVPILSTRPALVHGINQTQYRPHPTCSPVYPPSIMPQYVVADRLHFDSITISMLRIVSVKITVFKTN